MKRCIILILLNDLTNRDLWRLAVKSNERQYIYTLFNAENFSKLYQVQTEVIQQMLSLDTQEEFEDFLESGDSLEEDVF